jgi:hypothetical protein
VGRSEDGETGDGESENTARTGQRAEKVEVLRGEADLHKKPLKNR